MQDENIKEKADFENACISCDSLMIVSENACISCGSPGD